MYRIQPKMCLFRSEKKKTLSITEKRSGDNQDIADEQDEEQCEHIFVETEEAAMPEENQLTFDRFRQELKITRVNNHLLAKNVYIMFTRCLPIISLN